MAILVLFESRAEGLKIVILFSSEMGFIDTYFKAKIFSLSKKCKNGHYSTDLIARRRPKLGHFFPSKMGFLDTYLK